MINTYTLNFPFLGSGDGTCHIWRAIVSKPEEVRESFTNNHVRQVLKHCLGHTTSKNLSSNVTSFNVSGRVAQSVECLTAEQDVMGSTPMPDQYSGLRVLPVALQTLIMMLLVMMMVAG